MWQLHPKAPSLLHHSSENMVPNPSSNSTVLPQPHTEHTCNRSQRWGSLLPMAAAGGGLLRGCTPFQAKPMHLIPDAAACQGRRAKKPSSRPESSKLCLSARGDTSPPTTKLGWVTLTCSRVAQPRHRTPATVVRLWISELPKGLSTGRALYGEVVHGQPVIWAFSRLFIHTCPSTP